ncbi:MAG: hypothetical protein KAR35_08015 [Candidatus Heimdallarchaeota archaeon]|nr:hypothetical protein [Candidatus Heimdallarchaeota archaeon]MCK5049304.1 hypothetical protein [Candidatus Heimdallarchaeota archaeon]
MNIKTIERYRNNLIRYSSMLDKDVYEVLLELLSLEEKGLRLTIGNWIEQTKKTREEYEGKKGFTPGVMLRYQLIYYNNQYSLFTDKLFRKIYSRTALSQKQEKIDIIMLADQILAERNTLTENELKILLIWKKNPFGKPKEIAEKLNLETKNPVHKVQTTIRKLSDNYSFHKVYYLDLYPTGLSSITTLVKTSMFNVELEKLKHPYLRKIYKFSFKTIKPLVYYILKWQIPVSRLNNYEFINDFKECLKIRYKIPEEEIEFFQTMVNAPLFNIESNIMYNSDYRKHINFYENLFHKMTTGAVESYESYVSGISQLQWDYEGERFKLNALDVLIFDEIRNWELKSKKRTDLRFSYSQLVKRLKESKNQTYIKNEELSVRGLEERVNVLTEKGIYLPRLYNLSMHQYKLFLLVKCRTEKEIDELLTLLAHFPYVQLTYSKTLRRPTDYLIHAEIYSQESGLFYSFINYIEDLEAEIYYTTKNQEIISLYPVGLHELLTPNNEWKWKGIHKFI